MIHRTCQGQEPSGGAEDGRSIVQIGDVFVEYSGATPTPDELEAHLRPPIQTDSLHELCVFLVAKGVVDGKELKTAMVDTDAGEAIAAKIDEATSG